MRSPPTAAPFAENRGMGIGAAVCLRRVVLRVDAGRIAFQHAGDGVTKLLSYAHAGSHFVFGDLANPGSQLGYFAFGVLSHRYFYRRVFRRTVLLGIMQIIIKILPG